MERITITLEEDLLAEVDALSQQRGYASRSEAIRDLIRGTLVQKEWEDLNKEMVGTLTLVYDHHHSDLAQKMTEIQHSSLDVIITSLHIHLDHHNCMEVLILRGPGQDIKATAERLISTKGVKHGKLTLATTGQDLK